MHRLTQDGSSTQRSEIKTLRLVQLNSTSIRGTVDVLICGKKEKSFVWSIQFSLRRCCSQSAETSVHKCRVVPISKQVHVITMKIKPMMTTGGMK